MNEPLGECFDPKAPWSISEHCRPHWSQAGAVIFITFRTADSIPREVLQLWEREKNDWITRITGIEQPWREALPTLSADLQNRFRKQFHRKREDFLDDCCGACVLRRPELAKIVANSLLHFDGERYRMGDFIVMPNHVHLLASFSTEAIWVAQCDSWLHFTAREINRTIGRTGKFWQQEPFDHLVRSPAQYEYLRGYIRDNGSKAGLSEKEYLYYSHQGSRFT